MGKEIIPDSNRCLHCKHFYNLSFRTCRAFKDIPEDIFLGYNDHTEPLKDQGNDIVFEKKE